MNLLALREWLYPLGFLASIAFGLRFILQWLNSEKKQKSVINPLFWKLSLTGNSLLIIHSFIQLQFHVCIIQVVNAVISWRNLNLIKGKGESYTFKQVVILLLMLIAFTTSLFFLQSYLLEAASSSWFRAPNRPDTKQPIGMYWHMLGFFGLALFNSRFWIQWWVAEKTKVSSIGRYFWWISLAGAFLALVYFVKIKDYVNIVGPAIGIIPYIRNLMLLAKTNSKETVVES